MRRRKKVSEIETVEIFKTREGDTLDVTFAGAVLQIAPYSTVTIDSAIYHRVLREGEDPAEVYEVVYGYLRRKCIEKARVKLSDFAEEHSKAKERASGK